MEGTTHHAQWGVAVSYPTHLTQWGVALTCPTHHMSMAGPTH